MVAACIYVNKLSGIIREALKKLMKTTILLIFQVSVHFMILAEERWCRETFGEPFLNYLHKVRRYL